MTARDLPFGAAPKLAKDFAGIEERLPYELAGHYPQVLAQIEALWPESAVLAHLDSLLFADRPDRQGFTEEALAEIFFLKQLHDLLYPQAAVDTFATATDTMTERVRPRSVQELAQWYPARGGGSMTQPAVTLSVVSATESSHTYHRSLADRPHVASHWPLIDTNEALRQLLQRREPGQPLWQPSRAKLGEILLDRGLVSAEQIERALEMQSSSAPAARPLLGQLLLRLAATAEEDLARALCVQEGVPLVDLDRLEISADARSKIPFDLARQHRAIPVLRVGKLLAVAVENPLAFPSKDFLSFYTNLSVELVCAARMSISWRLEHYDAGRSAAQLDEEFTSMARYALRQAPLNGRRDSLAPAIAPASVHEEDATVIDLVNKMVTDALAQKATDIHIEARGEREASMIRFRRDGQLERYSEFPAAFHDAVIARLKIMSDLDIAEKRKPQDGKIDFARFTGRKLEIRLATVPTVRGAENASLRLLAAGEPLPLDRIGMSTRDLDILTHVIERPHGLVLVCGPTGSGKTTTLHSLLARLNTPERKIWTAEDPVEITQRGLSQVQVMPKIGWTFAAALRAFLRADPDVIMIGEMRDEETGRIAIEASMTGHLVLSTLHTNSAAETAVRLLELGVDPFSLSDALLAIVSQRLARRLCRACRESYEPKPEELAELAAEYHYAAHRQQPGRSEREQLLAHWHRQYDTKGSLRLYRARGCDQCKDTGYAGRLGVYEVMLVDERIRHAIRDHAPASGILATALAGGMLTLKQDGIVKVLQGITDLREVRANCV
jgi:type II secretory ATPase GspE/PulE/Tfp pilus assembly ATPase PilB-like protein